MSQFVTPPRSQQPGVSAPSVVAAIDARRAANQHTLSFEFFPPKEGGETTLWETFDRILEVAPDWVSLTYGAGGSNRAKSFTVLERMAPEVLTVGHLTCIGASEASTTEAIRKFEDLGVKSVLALRGDAPKDNPDALAQGELKTALELVEVAHRVSQLEIGVAAFPEGHPESPSLQHDAEVFALKMAAGASYGFTQLFFGVDYYVSMVEAAKAAGADLPIVPGLMPVSNGKQLLRMAAMSGAAVPENLARQLDESDEATAKAIGMEFTIQLGRDLLAAGAPGLHIFTLNQSAAALELATGVGLIN